MHETQEKPRPMAVAVPEPDGSRYAPAMQRENCAPELLGGYDHPTQADAIKKAQLHIDCYVQS